MSPTAYVIVSAVLLCAAGGTPWGQGTDPRGGPASARVVQATTPPPPYTPVPPPPSPGTIGAFLVIWEAAYSAMGHAEYRGVQRLDAAVAASRTAADGAAIVAAMDDLLVNRLKQRQKIGELRVAWRTRDFPAEPDKDYLRRFFDKEAIGYTDRLNSDTWGVEAAIRRAVARLRALQGTR